MQGRSHSMSMSNSGVGNAGGSSNASASGSHNPTGASSTLSVTAENRMNLAALQQKDPYITDIVDTAKQVALYLFSAKENEWERTSIEGTLFVYRRSASPDNGFMILNRLGPNNLIEPITKDLEFQLHDPFLLYRTVKAIYGIWFYDKDECARVGQLMNSLVQLAITNHQTKTQISTRQRRASESDSMDDRGLDVLNDATAAPHGANAMDPSRPVGIIQLLSKAQHEYNKSKEVRRKPEPVLITDRPNKPDANSSSLIRPTPLCGSATRRYANGEGLLDGITNLNLGPGATGGHEQSQICLETLFQNNIQSKVSNTSPLPNNQRSYPSGDNDSSQLPAILKHLGSTVPMVEDIERQHRGELNLSGSQVLANTQLRDASRNPDLQQNNLLSYFDTNQQQTSIPPLSTANILGQGVNFQQTSVVGPALSSDQVLALSQSPKTGPLNVHQATTDGQRSSLLLKDPSVSNVSLLTRNNAEKNCRSELMTNLLRGGLENSSNSTNRTQVTSPGPQSLLTPADLESLHSSNVMGGGASASGGALNSDTLLSPMAFITQQQRTTSLSRSSNNSLDVAESGADVPMAALTKEQLQQALIYLLKNDPSFLAKIHEAYLLSLNPEISNS